MSQSRRGFLTGAAGLAAAGLAAAAGCAGRETATAEPSPLERWTPPADRNQLVGSALGSSTASYLSYDGLLARSETLAPPVREPLDEERAKRAGQYDLPPGQLAGLVSVGTVTVYPGLAEGETAGIQRALSGGGYERDGGHGGYRFYHTDTETVAVGDGAVLSGPRSDFVRRSMRAMIDAADGDGDRRADVDDDFGLAAVAGRGADTVQVDSLFPVAETDVDSGAIAGNVALGVGHDVGDDHTETELRYVFQTEEDVDVDAFERMVDKGGAFDPYDLAEPRVDGRVIALTGTLPTWEFDFLQPGSPNGIDPSER